MNRQLDEVLLQRGRLIERIASQRAALQQNMQPIAAVLDKADSAAAGARSLVASIRRHPVAVSLAVAALFVLKGKTILRWGKRGFTFWRTWRLVQEIFQNQKERIRPFIRL